MINAYISGTGFNVPNRIVDNYELSKYMDTSNEWILERTGIKERRYVDKGIGPAELSIPAVKDALVNANLSINEIDFIIFATSTPDYYAPGSGCLLQEKMGFNNIGALDIRVQCCGFIYGLSIAHQYILSGMYSNILLVCSEVQSTAMDLSNRGRDVSVIFGDGAAATVISRQNGENGIISTHLHSEGKYAKSLWLESPSSKNNPRITDKILSEGKQYLKMNGKEVFKHAVTRFPQVINEALDSNGYTYKDIDMLIPHQANIRITQMIQKKMKLKNSQVYSNIHKYGNTTAASIPIALAELNQNESLNDGDLVMLAAFGAGFTWASSLIKW